MRYDKPLTLPKDGRHGGSLSANYHEYGLAAQDEDEGEEAVQLSPRRFAVFAALAFLPALVLLLSRSFG